MWEGCVVMTRKFEADDDDDAACRFGSVRCGSVGCVPCVRVFLPSSPPTPPHSSCWCVQQ